MPALQAKFMKYSHKASIWKRFQSEEMNQVTKYSKKDMTEKLGFTAAYSLQETILDCANSLIETGVVKYVLFVVVTE